MKSACFHSFYSIISRNILILFLGFIISPSSEMLFSHLHNKRILPLFRITQRRAHEVYCPDPSYPRDTSIRTSQRTDLPPLIYHIVTEKDWKSVISMIQWETNLPIDYLQELIEFGGIYLEKPSNKPPAPPPPSPPAVGTSTNGNQILRKSKVPMRRILSDCFVRKDMYCRVHVNPRRYLLPQVIDWQYRLLPLLHGKYLVVNKPSGLPTGESLDNRIENIVYQVNHFLSSQLPVPSSFSSSLYEHSTYSPIPTIPITNTLSPSPALEMNQPLALFQEIAQYLHTSRLDACTAGLLMLTNSSDTASNYHELLFNKQVRKVYKALTYNPLPIGVIQHLLPKAGKSNTASSEESNGKRHPNAKPTLPRNINDNLNLTEDPSRWQSAELIVLQSRPRYLQTLNSDAQNTIGKDPFNPNPASLSIIYENEIQLITGRTHQIRLQLAALGSAIIGDSRYQPVNGLVYQGKDTIYGDGSEVFGREPKQIFLECSQLGMPIDFFSGLSGLPMVPNSSIEATIQENELNLVIKRSFWESQ